MNTMNTIKTDTPRSQIIFSAQLMKHLVKLGYLPFDISVNYRDPSKIVWYFKTENGIENIVADWIAVKKASKAIAN